MRRTLALALTLALTPLLAAAPSQAGSTLVVGSPYASIQDAVDAALPGDVIFVPAGVYQEEVTITTPRITLRGEDRLDVILEGADGLTNGVTVAADGVAVESMTVQNFDGNGVFFSHVDGFRMHDLFAKDNGVYGLYAIHSTNGDIGWSYATGHGDGGLYIGETVHCDCDVHHNVVWGNMLGYSGTANSYVRIHDNEFFENRAGILMSVLPNEMGVDDETAEVYGTQVHTSIYGNKIYNNNNKSVPESGIWETVHVPVGEGITIAGGWMNDIHDNEITGNALWGIGVFWLTTPPRANQVYDNEISGSRYGIWWDEWGEDHCFEDNAISNVEVVSDPAVLPTCDGLLGEACPPALIDLAACRGNDVRAPSALKDAQLARRSLTDQDPHEG